MESWTSGHLAASSDGGHFVQRVALAHAGRDGALVRWRPRLEMVADQPEPPARTQRPPVRRLLALHPAGVPRGIDAPFQETRQRFQPPARIRAHRRSQRPQGHPRSIPARGIRLPAGQRLHETPRRIRYVYSISLSKNFS